MCGPVLCGGCLSWRASSPVLEGAVWAGSPLVGGVWFPGSAGVLRGQEAEFNDDSSIIIRARWTLRVTYHLYIVTSDDIVMKFPH